MCIPPVTASGRPSPSRSPTATVLRCVGDGRDVLPREPHHAVVLEPQQARRPSDCPSRCWRSRAARRDRRRRRGRRLRGWSRPAGSPAGAARSGTGRVFSEPLHALPRAAVRRRVLEARRHWRRGDRDRRRDRDRPPSSQLEPKSGLVEPHTRRGVKRPPPALTKAQISSHSWLMSVTRSGRPSPSKSAGTALMPPDSALQDVHGTNRQPPAFSSQLVSPSS